MRSSCLPWAVVTLLFTAVASAQPSPPTQPAAPPAAPPPLSSPDASASPAPVAPSPSVAPPASAPPGSPPPTMPPAAPAPAPQSLPPPPPAGAWAPAPPPGLSAGMPGGPPSARLERLRAVLTQVDAEAEDAHLPVLLAGLGVGAATIPAGAVMLSREGDREALAIGGGVLLGTGIGAVLGGVIQLFVPTGATLELDEELERASASGAPPDVVVLSVEQQWAEAAADARLGRKIGSVFGMGIGAIAVGAGTTVALVEPDGLSDTDQAVFAAALSFGGAMSLLGGIQLFFTETPHEVAWNAYAASNGLPREPLVRAPRLGLAPTPGGAGLALDGQF